MEKALHVAGPTSSKEFAVPVWCPYRKKDITVLEKIQKRPMKIPYDLKNLGSYEKRLARADLTNLEDRRIRGDLILLFKFINGLDLVDQNCIPKSAPSRSLMGPAGATRSNSRRLFRQTVNSKNRNDFAHFTSVRDHFFRTG